MNYTVVWTPLAERDLANFGYGQPIAARFVLRLIPWIVCFASMRICAANRGMNRFASFRRTPSV